MDKVLAFLKDPFSFMPAYFGTFVFYAGVATAIVLLIVLFGVIGTKHKIKRNRKMIEAQNVVLSKLTERLENVSERLNVANENVLKVSSEVKDIVDDGNKQMAAIIFKTFPTRDEKSKADLFDKLGRIFTADTEQLEKVVETLKD